MEMQPTTEIKSLIGIMSSPIKDIAISITFLFCSIISFSQCDDFEVEIIFTHPTCHNFCDGSVDLLISGEEPITSEIKDVDGLLLYGDSGGGTIFILCSGWYYIYVEDAAGCVFIDSVELMNPAEIEVELLITDPSSPGECDGVVIADTVYNYAGDYESISYFWSGGFDSGIGEIEIEEVCGGEYTLTIGDEFGCSKVFDFDLGSLSNIPSNKKNIIKINTDPITGIITLKNIANDNLNVNIFNLAGQSVYSIQSAESIIEFNPNLGSGIYIYSIVINGSLIQTGKVHYN